MITVQQVVAKILTIFTEVPEEQLREKKPLKWLLREACRPSTENCDIREQYGVFQFHLYRDGNGLHLVVSLGLFEVRDVLMNLPGNPYTPSLSSGGTVATFDFADLIASQTE